MQDAKIQKNRPISTGQAREQLWKKTLLTDKKRKLEEEAARIEAERLADQKRKDEEAP